MISSHRNPLIKRVRKLQQKKYREREGAFFVEGIRVVLTALEQGAPIETIIYAPEMLTSDIALAKLAEQKAQGHDVIAVTTDVFQSLSGRDTAMGLGAVITARLQALDDFIVGNQSLLVALDSISDPGNLGTIVRTVDAAGATGIILLGKSTDPFHPAAVKASMGAVFTVPVSTLDNVPALILWAKRHGLQSVATSAHASHSFWSAPYQLPLLLLFGSEGEGLPADVQAQADLAVSIPMHGISSSLNLAVAAGLLLYEVRRSAPIADSAP